MITAVCLNPSIDRTLGVASFRYGGMNRVANSRNDAGGKGINVAITASQLGLEAECIGFLCRDNGRLIENRLLANGVVSDVVWLDGAVRVNIKLLDQSQGVVTEINEPGRPVTEADIERMTSLVREHAQESDFLVLSGSMPPGCPADYYRQLIQEVEGLDCRCVLDADGERLTRGLEAHPFMIKPNLPEMESVVGRTLERVEDVRDAALTYVEKGISVVAVSMGERGALITNGTETLYAPRLDVAVKSTVGAGDAMVAGLLAGFMAELPLEEAFVKGVASATASIMSEGTQLVDRALYRSMLGRVQVERI